MKKSTTSFSRGRHASGTHGPAHRRLADPASEGDPRDRDDARPSVSTSGTAAADRWQLAGPGFLDAGAFPEISFRSDLLAWVPAGWRTVGRLQVKGTEHELACRFDLRLDDPQPGGPPRLKVADSLVIDSWWVTRQRIPCSATAS
jgi:hypothetical protein